jgi:branched-chain amino acid transport system substrate-binding protein
MMKCRPSFISPYHLGALSFVVFLLLAAIALSGCRPEGRTTLEELAAKVDELASRLEEPAPLKIGLILSPVENQYTTLYGAQLALLQINSREGGVSGVPVELIIKDTRNDPELPVRLAEELIVEDGVVAIIGPNYSRDALKVAPVAQRYGVPLVTTTATNPAITEVGDFVFLAPFADTFQGEVMAKFARESLEAETAALLIQQGDPYTEGLAASFDQHFTALGGYVVVRESYSAGDTDFTPQLEAIAAQAPDVVFMPGFMPEVPLAIQQARTIPQPGASGIIATFLGGDGWESPNLAPLGGDAIEGSYFSTFFSPDTQDESAVDFVRSYRAVFSTAPDARAAMGYDALRLVVGAIRRAGSVEGTAIRDQLVATVGYEGATSIVSYDERRHPRKSAVIMEVKNGRVKLYQEVESSP